MTTAYLFTHSSISKEISYCILTVNSKTTILWTEFWPADDSVANITNEQLGQGAKFNPYSYQ